MIYLVGFIVFIIVIGKITEPISTAIAQWFAQKKFDQEMELERLTQENRERMYNDYISRKNK